MIRTIYVVSGSCGECSDRREWTVKAFTTRESADAFADRLVGTMQELGARRVRGGTGWVFPDRFSALQKIHDAMCALDPSFSTDYTGTEYTVYPVDLEEVP